LANALRLARSLRALRFPRLDAAVIHEGRLKSRYRSLLDLHLSQLREEIPVVLNDVSKVKELHEVRKKFKELRYILELSPDKAKVAPILKELTGLHDLLGSIHDDDVIIEYLKKAGNSGRHEVQARVMAHRMQSYKRFVKEYQNVPTSESSFLMTLR
jgi:CHAD domain-containing protein